MRRFLCILLLTAFSLSAVSCRQNDPSSGGVGSVSSGSSPEGSNPSAEASSVPETTSAGETTTATDPGSLAPSGDPATTTSGPSATQTTTAPAVRPDAVTFTNPVNSEQSPDPYVVYRDGWYYYMYTTGSSLVIRRARYLEEIGHKDSENTKTVFYSSANREIKGDVWAPEMYFIDGKWYLYASGNTGENGQVCHQIFVMESKTEDPFDGFRYVGLVAPHISSIDPTVLTDPDSGKRYMLWSQPDGDASCIFIVPMDSPIAVTASPVKISYPQYDWELRFGKVNEGPAVLVHDGRIFVAYSANGFSSQYYCLGLLCFKGGNILDPSAWEKLPEPVFQKSDANHIYGVGHCAFTKSTDGTEDWIVYHAFDTPEYSERKTRIQKFTWDSQGLPVFGVPQPDGVQMNAPSR